MSKKEENRNFIKASDFLKGRRPEKYSDSEVIEEPQINRSILEYHLETLVAHNGEKDFEYFAKRLLENEVCTNLITQTGPTAGGDGKTDTETYPVADDISLRWYLGEAGGKERWAVAISIQKTWKVKLKGDIESILSTKRAYTKIIFVTNQLISSKNQHKAQDELTKKYGIEIVIFSRLWIVEKVITNNYYDIVVDNLTSMKGVEFKKSKKIGPKDSSREIELENLEKEISDTSNNSAFSHQLAEDCLRYALVASELERPIDKVESYFLRAIRIAKNIGDKRQLLRFYYKKAWACFFVYDDVEGLSDTYDDVENLALESTDMADIELISNLFNVLIGAIRFEQITIEEAKIDTRAKKLEDKLLEVSKIESLPNNVHTAKTQLCIHKLALISLYNKTSEIDDVLSELTKIFEDSSQLGSYAFESYAQIVIELGEFIGTSPAYENLFDVIHTKLSQRKSEVAIGNLFTERGMQQLKAGNHYEAIKWFGKAQSHLIKDEHRADLIRCLLGCGAAYGSVGLLWAARSNILAALSFGLREFHESGVMYYSAAMAAKELARIELQLGRIPHVLASLSIVNFTYSNIKPSEEIGDIYQSFCMHFDINLAFLLLRLNFEQLTLVRKLPYILENEMLFCSTCSTIFALGSLDKLRDEKYFGADSTDSDIEGYFDTLLSQEDSQAPIATPDLLTSEKLAFKTNILGCTITFEVESSPKSILIAETLLSAIESFLATSLENEVMPHSQEVVIKVKPSSSEKDIQIIPDSAMPEISVTYPENFALDSKELYASFSDSQSYFIAVLLPKIAIFRNLEKYMSKLANDENVFGRALIFSDSITVSNNVFGDLEWLKFNYWTDKIGAEPFKVLRSEQWQKKEYDLEEVKDKIKIGSGEIPPELFDTKNLKHTDRKVISLINIALWDKAEWSGTFFMHYEKHAYPPALGIMFKDEEAARAIFTEWRKRLGEDDSQDQIRISIIKGVDKEEPYNYKVNIGSNLDLIEQDSSKRIIIPSRINIMRPTTSHHLNVFFEGCNKHNEFYLMPAIYVEKDKEPKLLEELSILKHKIIVRQAWEISENDQDIFALSPDDNPIIPDEETDAPVIKALERIRSFKK